VRDTPPAARAARRVARTALQLGTGGR